MMRERDWRFVAASQRMPRRAVGLLGARKRQGRILPSQQARKDFTKSTAGAWIY